MSDINYEYNNGFMQSVTQIPRVINENPNFQGLKSNDAYAIKFDGKSPDGYQTPKLPDRKYSFRDALILVKPSKEQSPTSLINYDLIPEQSVSSLDATDSQRLKLRQSKTNKIVQTKQKSNEYEILLKPLLNTKEDRKESNLDDATSQDLSFTKFLTGMKASDMNKSNQSKNLPKRRLAKNAFSYDFTNLENYISPNDISISIVRDMERSKQRHKIAESDKESRQTNVHDSMHMHSKDCYDHPAPLKSKEKSVKLISKVEDMQNSPVLKTKQSEMQNLIRPDE